MILPNLIATNMYSEPGSSEFIADVGNPSETYVGLGLALHGHPEKRTVMFHIRNEDNLELKRVKVYISFDGMCSRLWLAPEDNVRKFNKMLLDGLETIHNRAGMNNSSSSKNIYEGGGNYRSGSSSNVDIMWDLVFTPGGRVSVEMIAGGGSSGGIGGGGERIAMGAMKQVQDGLVGLMESEGRKKRMGNEEEEGGWSGGVMMRDLNISYNEKML